MRELRKSWGKRETNAMEIGSQSSSPLQTMYRKNWLQSTSTVGPPSTSIYLDMRWSVSKNIQFILNEDRNILRRWGHQALTTVGVPKWTMKKDFSTPAKKAMSWFFNPWNTMTSEEGLDNNPKQIVDTWNNLGMRCIASRSAVYESGQATDSNMEWTWKRYPQRSARSNFGLRTQSRESTSLSHYV